jgi:hypothetical protein
MNVVFYVCSSTEQFYCRGFKRINEALSHGVERRDGKEGKTRPQGTFGKTAEEIKTF